MIPAGVLPTVPLPVPVLLTDRGSAALKVAVQPVGAVIHTAVIGAVPVQAKLQPAKTEPGSG